MWYHISDSKYINKNRHFQLWLVDKDRDYFFGQVEPFKYIQICSCHLLGEIRAWLLIFYRLPPDIVTQDETIENCLCKLIKQRLTFISDDLEIVIKEYIY